MSKKTESNSYTIIFTIIMVVLVATILSFVFIQTKPRILENQKIEKKQNILFSMGINKKTVTGLEEDVTSFVPSKDANTLFEKHILKQYVLESGKYMEDNEAYLINIKKELDKEKSGQPSRKPIFIAQKDGAKYYIIPVRGSGLWDAIWGYITLDKALVVRGVFFDHKGETPGLGAEIKNKYFQDRFIGEKILDVSGQFKGIKVLKGNNDPQNLDKEDNEVDAISGATITGDGVTRMIYKGLGYYVDYLEMLNL